MKRLNKKGFTLIELLAVIVILGVLLAIAIPSVSKYISDSKKSTYVSNVKAYANSAVTGALSGAITAPINEGGCTVVTFEKISIEKGGKTSSYGKAYKSDNSFVVIKMQDSKFKYYIAANDGDDYGIGVSSNGSNTGALIDFDALNDSHILKLSSTAYSASGLAKNSTLTLDDGTTCNVEAVIQ